MSTCGFCRSGGTCADAGVDVSGEPISATATAAALIAHFIDIIANPCLARLLARRVMLVCHRVGATRSMLGFAAQRSKRRDRAQIEAPLLATRTGRWRGLEPGCEVRLFCLSFL